MSETQAIVISETGGPEVMRWQAVELPAPGPGEVRLRHTAAGVNYIDVYIRNGLYSMLALPGTPGMEAAGVVEAVGEGVTDWRPGDRAAYVDTRPGAYARHRNIDASLLIPLPDSVADTTAAAVLLKGLTAEMLLHRVHPVSAGETVLVHAAAGGVGSLLVQWARHLGATVIGTAGSKAKCELAERLGCHHTINYSESDFAERVMALTNDRGADVAFDGVGRASFAGSLASVKMTGHVVSYGQSSGAIEPFTTAELAQRSLTLSRPVLFHYIAGRQREAARALFEALEAGWLAVSIDSEWPMDQAAEAHRRLEARESRGAMILKP